MKGWPFKTARTFLDSSVANLESHKSSVESLKIFEKVLNSVSFFQSSADKNQGDEEEDISEAIISQE